MNLDSLKLLQVRIQESSGPSHELDIALTRASAAGMSARALLSGGRT